MPGHQPGGFLKRWLPIVSLSLMALVVLQPSVLAFTLTSPVEGAALKSGETVPVAVELGKDTNLRTIHYYWYRLDEEPLPTHQASPASFTPLTPPVEKDHMAGTVSVPAEALGTMRLLAVGEVVRGRLGIDEDFDEVMVAVEPAALLSSIDFAVQRPWRLDTIGKLLPVPVVGQFEDGVARPLSGPRTGSRFLSSNETVVSIDASGILRVVGNGRAQVIVENRGKTGTVDVIVEGDETPNRPPVAEVEKELRTKSGHLVLLDGLRSRDPDGDPLRYEWKQLRGYRIVLTNAQEVKATFVAPKVSEPKLLQFSLTVTDMAGPDTVKGAESSPAVISIWVDP
ncbi:MAG TPA: hypothetical protein VJ746_13605 [Nitrospira sp.]|nr:hypothetical protein [Nitrospira sp.]